MLLIFTLRSKGPGPLGPVPRARASCQAPLNGVPLLLAGSTAALRDLGAAGLLAAGLHIMLAMQVKSEGLKYI